MNALNFDKYSLEELRSSLASIDREKYPENYARLLKAIELKTKEHPEPPKQKTWRVDWRKHPDAGIEPIKKVRHGFAVLWVGLFSLCALAGLLSGKLWIPGGRGNVIEGIWARVISAMVLICFAWIFYSGLANKKDPKDGPPDKEN